MFVWLKEIGCCQLGIHLYPLIGVCRAPLMGRSSKQPTHRMQIFVLSSNSRHGLSPDEEASQASNLEGELRYLSERQRRSFFRSQEKGGHDGGSAKEARSISKEQELDDEDEEDEESQDERTTDSWRLFCVVVERSYHHSVVLTWSWHRDEKLQTFIWTRTF